LNEKKAIARKKYDEAMRVWELATLPYRKEAERRRAALQGAKNQLRDAEQSWSSTSSSAIAQFERKKRDLAALRSKHAEIETQRNSEWQQLQARVREIQKRDFLDTFFVENVKLNDIGPTRKADLLSLGGIETANDIEIARLMQVPGFGPKRIGTLLAWRQEVEAKFSFNPTTGVPQQEKLYFESKFQQLLQPIQQQLLAGQKELEAIKQSADAQLARICEQIKICTKRCRETEADTRSIPKGL
jgi:DNA-binding helix-hairpin-helix protein with protein kinase domain